MPTVIDIPKVGQIAFPDTMSDEEINVAAGELYDQSIAEKMAALKGQMARARSASTRSGAVESAVGGAEFMTQGLADPVGTLLKGTHAALTMLTRQPYEAVDLQAPIIDPGAIKDSWLSQTIIGSPGIPETISGLTTLENVALTGTMGVAPASRVALAGTFSALGAKHTPEAATELGRASVEGSGEEMATASYGALATGTMAIAPVAGAMALSRKGAPSTAAIVDNAAMQLGSETTKPKRARVDVENLDAVDAAAELQAAKPQKPVETKLKEGAADVRSGIPSVDARWDAAHGIGKKSLWTRTKEKLTSAKENFQRHFIDLDPKTDGAVINTLRVAEEIPIYSKFTAARNMSGIIGKLDKAKMDVFERAVILPDLVKDVEAGLHSGKDLPFGYPNDAALKSHASRVGDVAAKTPEVAEAIKAREDLWAGLRQEAVDMGLLDKKVLDDPRYFHHQVLAHMRLKDPATTGSSSKDLRVGRKGYQKARIGSEKDYNTKYIESEFEVMSQIISQLETRKALNAIRRDADISTELAIEAKARGVSVADIIPDGYAEWQPVPGNRFYQSLTIQDKFVDAFFAGERALKQGDFKEGMVVGGKKETWIIPERVAKTLDNFRDDSMPKGIEKWAMKANTAWKQWTLLNPTRFLKYSLNNMSGDFDIAFAYNPRIMSHIGEAHKLSREAVFNKGRVSEELDFLQKQGVVNSNFAVHEIPDIGKSALFSMIEGSNPNLLARYWNKTKDYNNYRENILRIAAYKFFKSELDAGRTRYGASKPEMVDAIKNPREKAALLARELIGDYGNISSAGQYIRSRLMPFYSWMEINTKRYPQLVKNLRAESLKELDTGGGAKRLALGTAVRAGGKMAKHSAQIGALYAFVTLWNRTFFPDEEQDLGLSDRRQLHLILGRNKEGQVRSLRFQGALSDFLSWVGAEDFPQDIVDVGSGRATLQDKFKEAAQAPVEKLINASMPMVKGAGEALTGKSLYPDPSNPRMIRDRAEHIASVFSLRTIYKYMAGHPTRGVASDIASLILYTSDPGEAAYYSSRTILYQWMKKNNVETPGGEPTRRSNALYYWRQSKKYGDEELAAKWMKRYEDLGGTAQGIRASIKAQHPMAPLPNQHREGFDQSLGAEEREIFRKAEEWYERTYTEDAPAPPE